MFILRAVCAANPGQEEDARAAARDLMEQARSHEGIKAYFWTVDEATGELVDWEVHDDERSLTNHIELTDLSRMAATMTVKRVETYGDTPSAALQETLRGFAEHTHFPIV
jgi:quinol monooxygenase YgiN